MRILVVGAGALGGYYGGRLAAAGRDATFLVRPRRAEQLSRTGGLVIVDPAGGATIPNPRLIQADGIDGRYDVVLLTCKSYDLESCMDDIAPAVGQDTMILPVLNGMRHIDLLNRRFGAEKVLGGRAMIFATLDDDGRVLHQAAGHSMSYGEQAGGISPRVAALHKIMAGAGFDAYASENILQDMWDKWVRIAAVAGSTSLMRAPIGDIVSAGGSFFMERLLDEGLRIAAANGYPTPEAFIASTQKILLDPSSRQMGSMAKDILKGFRIEADHIIGDFLARAPKAEEETYILLKTILVSLKSYKRQRG